MAKSRKVKIVLAVDITEAERQVKAFGSRLESLGGKTERFGSSLAKLAAPLALLGGMAIKSAFHIDEAFDTLAVKSGATGRELENLKQDFKSLAPQVTQPFEATAEVLGDLYTRLNLSGEGLQSMGRAALDAGRLLKEDLTSVVTGSTRVMKDWGVANEQGTILLDKLFLQARRPERGWDSFRRSSSGTGPHAPAGIQPGYGHGSASGIRKAGRQYGTGHGIPEDRPLENGKGWCQGYGWGLGRSDSEDTDSRQRRRGQRQGD
jgi:hypothetical protein